MNPDELKLLAIAKDCLENPNYAIKIADKIGMPIEYAINKLPDGAKGKIGEIVDASLRAAYDVAKHTIVDGAPSWWQTYLNRGIVTASGAAGGVMGLAGAAVEIPFSTTIFFREMIQNAMVHGFDPRDPKICMEVLSCFSYGGRSKSDDASESSYFMVRSSIAKCVTDAAEYMAGKLAGDIADDLARPVLVNLIEKIAARFFGVVTDELAAKCVPIIGALGAVAINNVFIHHFANISDSHFYILKLENKYGNEIINEAYENIGPTR